MTQDTLTALISRIKALRNAGKTAEADKVEKGISNLLEEANKTPVTLVIEIDMGTLPFVRDFTKDGFHMEKPRQHGLTKFEVKSIVEDGESPVSGDEMQKRAEACGCHTDQQEGDHVAVFLNSRAGKEASKALLDSGCLYIVLPNKDGIWVLGSTRLLCVPILHWDGEQWVSDLYSLGRGFGSHGRFLVPCKL